MSTLGDIPASHRTMLAGRAENARSQLAALVSALQAAQPTMPISTAYDGLCVVQGELDRLAIDIARYGEKEATWPGS